MEWRSARKFRRGILVRSHNMKAFVKNRNLEKCARSSLMCSNLKGVLKNGIQNLNFKIQKNGEVRPTKWQYTYVISYLFIILDKNETESWPEFSYDLLISDVWGVWGLTFNFVLHWETWLDLTPAKSVKGPRCTSGTMSLTLLTPPRPAVSHPDSLAFAFNVFIFPILVGWTRQQVFSVFVEVVC